MQYVAGVLSFLWFVINTDVGATLFSLLIVVLAVRLFVGAWAHRVSSSSMRRHDDGWK
jgi:hypothetical protein